MSDLDRNYGSPFGRVAGRVDAATVDAGLRAYMLRIYNYMSIGLAITGLAALGIYMAAVTADPSGAAAKIGNAFLTPFGYAMFVSPLKWLFILAPLVMVFVISAGINRLRPATAQMLFWAFSALMGVSLSSIFLVYTHTSIVRVFFITAATFGALSLYGYTTKRDMTGMGSFLFMGLIGVVIASVVNIFLGSSMLQFAVSVIGVMVFAGLTAWDTQRLKNEYVYGYASAGGDVAEVPNERAHDRRVHRLELRLAQMGHELERPLACLADRREQLLDVGGKGVGLDRAGCHGLAVLRHSRR